MSVAYYIVLDIEEPDFDTFVNGKQLAQNLEDLDAVCKKLGIQTFENYVTMSEDDLADMLGDDVELPEGEGEQWFEAKEGIAWVAALSAHIRAHPSDVQDSEGVLDELAEYAEVFEKAGNIGAKWHLNLDI